MKAKLFLLSIGLILPLVFANSALAGSEPIIPSEVATEVSLDKPGISYVLPDRPDIYWISQADNFIFADFGDEAIIYRSHYEPEVMAILSPFNFPEHLGTPPLSVRIQFPLRWTGTPGGSEVDIELSTNIDINSLDIDKAKDLSWDIPSIKSDLTHYRGGKDGIAVEILPAGWSEEIEKTTAKFHMSNATLPLAEETVDEIVSLLAGIGFYENRAAASEAFETAAKEYLTTGSELVPAINIDPDEFDWGKAIGVELRWLVEKGVIKGLSEADIKEISSVCRRGTAGNNGRIIFKGGQWLPYSESGHPPKEIIDWISMWEALDTLPEGILEDLPESEDLSESSPSPSSFNFIWIVVGVAVAGAGIGLWYRRRVAGKF